MPLFLARASARGIFLILQLAFGAPAESLKRGAWGFLGSVDGGIARMARLRGVQKRGVLFSGVCGRRSCKFGAPMDFRREYYLDKAVFTVCSGDGGIKKVT